MDLKLVLETLKELPLIFIGVGILVFFVWLVTGWDINQLLLGYLGISVAVFSSNYNDKLKKRWRKEEKEAKKSNQEKAVH